MPQWNNTIYLHEISEHALYAQLRIHAIVFSRNSPGNAILLSELLKER